MTERLRCPGKLEESVLCCQLDLLAVRTRQKQGLNGVACGCRDAARLVPKPYGSFLNQGQTTFLFHPKELLFQ